MPRRPLPLDLERGEGPVPPPRRSARLAQREGSARTPGPFTPTNTNTAAAASPPSVNNATAEASSTAAAARQQSVDNATAEASSTTSSETVTFYRAPTPSGNAQAISSTESSRTTPVPRDTSESAISTNRTTPAPNIGNREVADGQALETIGENSQEEDRCPICLDPIEDGGLERCNGCGIVCHGSCLHEWFLRSRDSTCPHW